jgi:CBS domain-containing protein
MNAADVMTTEVITVGPQATVREIAEILLECRITGVPVVEEGHVVGIVSEADLLRRHEIGTERRPRGPWWLRLLTGEPGPADYVKSHATHAADIMTRDVHCVSETTPIAEIAVLFANRAIKRVPVVRDGRLVGIVSRANLVQALAIAGSPRTSAPSVQDDAIRKQLLQELAGQAWWRADSNVLVAGGVVHYWGVCENDLEKQAARVAAENIPGVRRVEDHRTFYAELPYTMG